MNQLIKIIASSIISLLAYSSTCGQKKIKGDLFFKLITIGSYYNGDSVAVKNFDRKLDSLSKLDYETLSKVGKDMIDIYGGLKMNGLIDKPYFHIRTDSKTSFIVYTSPTEISKIKDFRMDDLIRDDAKIQIQLTGEIIKIGSLSVINCSTIDRVKKVDGKTYWAK